MTAAPMPPPRARQAVTAAGGGSTSVPKALHTVLAEVAACAVAPEGMGFTEKLNRAAFTAGGLVAAGRLRPHEAESLLREAATTARPNQDRRCESIIRTALEAGARRPLHPRGRE